MLSGIYLTDLDYFSMALYVRYLSESLSGTSETSPKNYITNRKTNHKGLLVTKIKIISNLIRQSLDSTLYPANPPPKVVLLCHKL